MVALKDNSMRMERRWSPEAQALERVAAAAREVQAGSAALETHYSEDGSRQPSMLELARFAAAMQELKDAREAFDLLVANGALPQE
jgi:hypothetical protein